MNTFPDYYLATFQVFAESENLLTEKQDKGWKTQPNRDLNIFQPYSECKILKC